MKNFIFAAALALAPSALAQTPAGPIALEASGDPSAVSEAFARNIAARYPQGANYEAARADVEKNGFACEVYPADPAHDAPNVQCTRRAAQSQCIREWSVDLAETSGTLRHPAEGSFAVMCVGAVLPPKLR